MTSEADEPPRFFAAKRLARRAAAAPLFLSLDALALVYRSDKRTAHGFLPHYRRHLGPRRFSVRRVLEIGVGGYDDPYAGLASLRMWRTFFPRAHLFGLDVNEKAVGREPRITVVRGSQADAGTLDRLLELAGGAFDLVIDDGSHVNEHVRFTFEHLFPHVTPGGLYVIEDVETAYLEREGGGAPGVPGTSVALAKDLVDGVNREYVSADWRPSPVQELVSALHFYPNIVFVERAPERG
ncbi:MAG TPA: class I SAM-dependent methyltransferase [Gaiellaceae bacterium]|nr:class I SAM-dependent methyltransferase [Gaiellaceae bacterium]